MNQALVHRFCCIFPLIHISAGFFRSFERNALHYPIGQFMRGGGMMHFLSYVVAEDLGAVASRVKF